MKKWNNPELKNLNVEKTYEEDTCPNMPSTYSLGHLGCEFYCTKWKGGCGGCKAEKCKITSLPPITISRCTCDETTTPLS